MVQPRPADRGDESHSTATAKRAKPFVQRPPLVLISGLAEQAETWFRNVDAWRQHFDVFVPHLNAYRGEAVHNRIAKDLPIDVPFLVEQLRVYLDTFVARAPYHFAANSMGGKIMVEFARRYPDQVAKLVLIAPSGLSEVERLPIVEGVRGRKMQEVIGSVFHNPALADPAVVAMYERQVRDKRWRNGLMRTIRGTMGHMVRDQVSELRCPTLLVVGENDRIVDSDDSIAAGKRIPNGQLVIMENCGHAPQIEMAETINRLVVDFLGDNK